MSYTLGEIAEISGAELDGDPGIRIERGAPLETAESSDISFLANRKYVRHLEITQAAAVILTDEHASRCPVEKLVCEDPYLAFVKVMRHMHPVPEVIPNLHSAAHISSDARVSELARVNAGVVIESNSTVSARVSIGACSVIGRDVEIGEGTRIAANVTFCDGTRIGRNCILHPGVVIGADGFGIVRNKEGWLKIPQTGKVQIGENVEIGANTTIDRGALLDTIIEDGVKLDNQIQVGHGVKIGAHTAIAGCTGIAGSTTIGKRCMIGGLTAISGHIDIADDVIITGMSGVSNSIKSAGTYSSGVPITDNARWRKNMARLKNLDDIARRVVELENILGNKTTKGDYPG